MGLTNPTKAGIRIAVTFPRRFGYRQILLDVMPEFFCRASRRFLVPTQRVGTRINKLVRVFRPV
jgi:hypothetical protein